MEGTLLYKKITSFIAFYTYTLSYKVISVTLIRQKNNIMSSNVRYNTRVDKVTLLWYNIMYRWNSSTWMIGM